VSTFYLLPSRPILGERFAGYLQLLFPGLDWGTAAWPDLAELLGAAAARHRDVYVIYGEELPPGEDPNQILAEGFGAAAGDLVIQITPGSTPGDVTTRRWRVQAPAGV
jgi:hypothetical protein